MTTLVDHARSMIAATIWADDRILAAADGISGEQYAQVRGQFGHMLGTQRWWHANWTGGTWEEPNLETLAMAREGYEASHEALRSYADALPVSSACSLSFIVSVARLRRSPTMVLIDGMSSDQR